MKKRTFLKLSSALITGSFLTPLSPLMSCKNEPRQHNWAGNLVYGTDEFREPESLQALIALVRQHEKVKILGTKHAFNTIADSNDMLVSLGRQSMSPSIDKSKNTVSVEAGMRYGSLADYLQKEGYALHNLASLPHISVAGACATATHGSGVHNGNLSSAVAEIEFLAATGDKVVLSREKDGEEFMAAIVHLGAMGVVTRLTLDIQPTFNVRQDLYEFLPLEKLRENLFPVLGAGYSVSLFTDWKNHNFNQVWLKSRTDSAPFAFGDEFYGAKKATRNLHPIVELSAENCTDQMGVPGPWHERLPHFKMNFTPSSGAELQAEYFVPLDHAYEALVAVDKLGEWISPHLLISEIRTIAADNFWMSPCYKQPSLAIHFTWKPDWPNVSKVLPRIEHALSPFNAKPHWAKMFTMDAAVLKSRYAKREAFKKFCAAYDPKGKFRNTFLDTFVF